MSALKVTLVRSWAGRPERQRMTLEGLRLYKLGDVRLLPDTQPVLGMIRKVHHLVAWERVDEAPAPNGRRSRSPARKRPAARAS
jgi:large subunit ribosomal protein L30